MFSDNGIELGDDSRVYTCITEEPADASARCGQTRRRKLPPSGQDLSQLTHLPGEHPETMLNAPSDAPGSVIKEASGGFRSGLSVEGAAGASAREHCPDEGCKSTGSNSAGLRDYRYHRRTDRCRTIVGRARQKTQKVAAVPRMLLSDAGAQKVWRGVRSSPPFYFVAWAGCVCNGERSPYATVCRTGGEKVNATVAAAERRGRMLHFETAMCASGGFHAEV
ncbi:unnamed protein product [Pleuronectes platessa]|uniref:Uncharacterized protein n=1 Tax=Pleuronectes platessa TaxID=8262 RepID=A0A9N7VUU3_PLEPL|nr:unnamed protein product [Pleuronectes platessa]